MSDRMDVNQLLSQMKALRAQTDAFRSHAVRPELGINSPSGGVPNVNGPQFSELFSQAINKVNDVQQASSATAKAYVRGDPNIDVTDVMIASQKSSVAFDAAVQVRNKVVEAYKDIMNMPI